MRHTEELCRLISDTPVSVKSWDRQKQVLSRLTEHDDIEIGFAMFFLNRTNRSGILNGGIIEAETKAVHGKSMPGLMPQNW